MGGLFEILFILVFIIAAVVDATTRKRKKQRRMEEMESEEEASRSRPGAGDEVPRGASSPGSATETLGSRGERGDSEGSPPQERQTADSMVADDFWAILTGQPRPGSSGAEAPDEDEPMVRQYDGRYVPASQAEDGTASASTTSGGPDGRATSSREGRGQKGEGRGSGSRVPDGGGQMDRPVDAGDRRRMADWDSRGRRGDESPPRDADIPMPLPGDRYSRAAGALGDEDDIARQEAEFFGEQAEPWKQMDDISEGEIGDGTGGLGDEDADAGLPGAGARRPARSSRGHAGRYTGLLESGSMEDLRKAVVLREVLDQPLGLRPGVEGGRAWTDEGEEGRGAA